MVRRLLGAGLLFGLVLALPAGELLAQKKKKDAAKIEAKPVDSSKLTSGDFAGTLKSVPGTDRVFTLEIEQVTIVPTGRAAAAPRGNTQAARAVQIQRQIAQAQKQYLKARTFQQRRTAANRITSLTGQLQRSIAQLQRAGAAAPAGFRYVTSKQEIEFQLRDVAKVRTMVLAQQFDEKGNPKKLTKAELAAAKGKDKNLPGYESSMEQLEVGQKVRLSLVATSAKKDAPGKKDGPGKKDADDEAKAKDDEKKMQVKQVVILGEATPVTPAARGKAKGKK